MTSQLGGHDSMEFIKKHVLVFFYYLALLTKGKDWEEKIVNDFFISCFFIHVVLLNACDIGLAWLPSSVGPAGRLSVWKTGQQHSEVDEGFGRHKVKFS